ncbi:hypothetical protein JW865_00975 [Candidatus Bathyarchaeota archaeon]|nr:hypothetical protein [Candidatus Bathyarchaeota archaeon]
MNNCKDINMEWITPVLASTSASPDAVYFALIVSAAITYELAVVWYLAVAIVVGLVIV